jgi:hypothetical protein
MFFFREYQNSQKEEDLKRYDQLMLLYALNMQKVEKSMTE